MCISNLTLSYSRDTSTVQAWRCGSCATLLLVMTAALCMHLFAFWVIQASWQTIKHQFSLKCSLWIVGPRVCASLEHVQFIEVASGAVQLCARKVFVDNWNSQNAPERNLWHLWEILSSFFCFGSVIKTRYFICLWSHCRYNCKILGPGYLPSDFILRIIMEEDNAHSYYILWLT